MNDADRPTNERVAFCQNCGRPLNTEEVRNVGSAVFCEPCLVAKVAAADAPGTAGAGTGAWAGPGVGGTPAGAGYDYRGTAGVEPPLAPPPLGGAPNPGLAALLGFIPGVGAFYNGQYAKGVVHLVVFATLTTLSEHSGIFGIFVAGWVFYQVIEAHHTARARRDGTPLPNPFGLNDVGERLGFGRAWPGGAAAAAAHAAPAPGAPAAGASEPGTGYQAPGYQAPGYQAAGYQAAGYAPASPGYAPSGSGYPPPPPGYAYGAPPAAGWGAPTDAYGNVPPAQPYPLESGRQVPTGAIVLIGLGVIFLIGNSGLFHGFPVHRLIPFLLIGVGVWVFVRKMTETGGSLSDDGTQGYRARLFRAARGPVWIVLVGVLFLLDTFNVLSWGRSWPLFIIVGGLMTFFERTAYSGSFAPQYGYQPGATAAVAPDPAGAGPVGTGPVASGTAAQGSGVSGPVGTGSVTPASTAVVPPTPSDREGI